MSFIFPENEDVPGYREKNWFDLLSFVPTPSSKYYMLAPTYSIPAEMVMGYPGQNQLPVEQPKVHIKTV